MSGATEMGNAIRLLLKCLAFGMLLTDTIANEVAKEKSELV